MKIQQDTLEKVNTVKEIYRKGRFIPPISFCEEITRRRCDGKGEGMDGRIGRKGGSSKWVRRE